MMRSLHRRRPLGLGLALFLTACGGPAASDGSHAEPPTAPAEAPTYTERSEASESAPDECASGEREAARERLTDLRRACERWRDVTAEADACDGEEEDACSDVAQMEAFAGAAFANAESELEQALGEVVDTCEAERGESGRANAEAFEDRLLTEAAAFDTARCTEPR